MSLADGPSLLLTWISTLSKAVGGQSEDIHDSQRPERWGHGVAVKNTKIGYGWSRAVARWANRGGRRGSDQRGGLRHCCSPFGKISIFERDGDRDFCGNDNNNIRSQNIRMDKKLNFNN